MSQPLFRDHPEPLSGAGELLLSPNHIALLQGLLDRPDGIAHSYRDWVMAAYPYMGVIGLTAARRRALRAMHSIHPRWVNRVRLGTRIASQLTERGHAILELQVPVRVRGVGRYRGLRQRR